ncbi:MAG: dihydroorotase [bacterium TMED88]|nr:dihydroorotase [Deltaproteobacteria bacterium]OUV37710.1 MAG: dihydroorotase [bacterium TMED88]
MIEIAQPDDWHVHLRDGPMLGRVAGETARQFGRAIIMPNLDPPVQTTDQAVAYRDRILASLPKDSSFQPLMTLYLTDETTPAEIQRATDSGVVFGVKLYPKGATTNAESGVDRLDQMAPVLEAMEQHRMPLLIHGESTDPDCDVFDREEVFLEEWLAPMVERHAGLRVVFEHITTKSAVDYVRQAPDRVGATLTPQHLLLNRNALFAGGLRPHHYCLPVLKRERDREALLGAATSGDPHFFLGTDSAPHSRSTKESACGCAGIYSAPIALELYAQAFASVNALDRLEGFASHFGADFYGLPRHQKKRQLRPSNWTVPDSPSPDPDTPQVFWTGQDLDFRLVDEI